MLEIMGDLVVLAVLLAAITGFFTIAGRAASKTKTRLDDLVLEKIRTPVYASAFAFTGYLVAEQYFSDALLLGYGHSMWSFIVFTLLGAMLINRAIVAVIKWYVKDFASRTKTKIDMTLITTMSRASWLFVYSVAILIIFGTMGIDIGPILAGLGIAGLAVALALQEPLGNLFAGLHMIADKPIRVGDYIRIEKEDVEGTIEEIGWRSVRILTNANNEIIIPNSRMAQAVIKNYGRPSEDSNVSISVSAAYESDQEKVRKMLEGIALEVAGESSFADQSFTPKVVLSDISGGILTFLIIFKIKGYRNRFAIWEQVRDKVLRKFKKGKVKAAYNTIRIVE